MDGVSAEDRPVTQQERSVVVNPCAAKAGPDGLAADYPIEMLVE